MNKPTATPAPDQPDKRVVEKFAEMAKRYQEHKEKGGSVFDFDPKKESKPKPPTPGC